jgi:DMSO reductase family type II enzyme heme b subunit
MLRSKFLQAALILVLAFAVFRYGIRPPAPWSVVTLYMAITLLAVLVYVSSDSDSWKAFLRPIQSTLVDDAKRPVRLLLVTLLPPLSGYYAYTQAAAKGEPPPELRAIHPAPPASISFRGKTIEIQGLENPLRKGGANLQAYVREGEEIYVKNCIYCHGDNLDGAGHFAHAFNPLPANFTDPGTIAMLAESFLFWRIAKGGLGLPKESAPWNSVMPAWEDRLTEEEIWKVILYLYDATGFQPRRWEGQASVTPSPWRGEGRGAAVAARPPRGEQGLWSAARAQAQQADDADAGKAVYEKKCAHCHGDKGDGNGPGAANLDPKPRDFTKGRYKIRTTPSGQPPSNLDLFRVITEGMPGTSMPPWQELPEKDRWNLVAYLKTFAPDSFREAPRPVALPREVPTSTESVARGKEMFEAIECYRCHGAAGRGDGPSAPELKDDWGRPVRPANLTKPWNFRGGPTTKEIATRLATGLMGSPMPAFLDGVETPEDIWHLANYVKSLGPDTPNLATLLTARFVQAEIPEDPTAPFWSQETPARFPLVGQVIVDPRNFTPSVDMIAVRAVYTEGEVAFHLAWDDPTASKPDSTGKRFADQVALQFPARISEGTERPYVLMGDGANPVYLLRWTSDGGVGEANASGPGAITPLRNEDAQAKGRAVYQDGRYRLVMKRPRGTPDRGRAPPFPVGTFIPVAFRAWDGDNGEVGSKFSMSSWYSLRLEPRLSRARWLYPPLVAVGVLGFELWGLWWARRRLRG